MAVIKCKMCGGDLNLVEGETVAECEYCGSRQTVPTADNEKKMTLFGRANRLRLACDFDKAAGIYENIAAEFPEEAEAYWGLVLCKYGIEYVDDPATAKKVPTCHRSSFDSIMEDSDFEQACENADSEARRMYREEAKAIEELRKGILEVSGKEAPYDIFICYKETDENGDRTLDSVLAQDTYDALVDKGYRVFFSRISLEDKLGQEYEPYIFAALNSAKIMLAFGTDYEYYNAVWVKNEWSRYLKLMASDKEKHLIPCYKGIDAYDIPKEFTKFQAQDMGKVGAVQDLLRGVEKLLGGKSTTVVLTAEPVVVKAAAPGVESLLKRGNLFLEDENWASAEEYFDKVLDIDPECAEAYLGKVLAKSECGKTDELSMAILKLQNDPDYQKVMRYGNEEIKQQVTAVYTAAQRKSEEEGARRAVRRKQILPVQGCISAGGWHTVGLRSDGTVVAVGRNDDGQCNVSGWRNIVAICAGDSHTVGLQSDGTVVAVGRNDGGQCNVSGWRNIVAICAGDSHTVGLQSDGTVVAVGYNNHGECDISGWRNIVAISAGTCHTVGLQSDGTVVAVGYNDDGQCNVSGWHDIVYVSAKQYHTVGLRSNGTVVNAGCKYSMCDWKDMVDVSARADYHTVGLQFDGTVVAVGHNGVGQCNVSDWHDIVAISTGYFHTVGLRSDGTVVSTNYLCDSEPSDDKCDVSGWKLFNSLDTLKEDRKKARAERKVLDEREAAERKAQKEQDIAKWKARKERKAQQAQNWRSQGLCQHCGGSFKGLFSKKCCICGELKDY